MKICVKKYTLVDPSQGRIQEELNAYTKWKRLADLEEEFMKRRSKMHWLDVGSGNNNFFHSWVKIREVRNAIQEIYCADGSIATTDEEIKGEAERYFTEFLNTKPQEFEGAEVDNLRELLGFQCNEEECIQLEREVTKEEKKR